MSTILKLFALPLSFLIICLGVLTILGGHITPGGGFQGGAMIAAGVNIMYNSIWIKRQSYKIFS